ncbi:MAG: carboxylesterase family protein [Acidimicrobiales bacterium]
MTVELSLSSGAIRGSSRATADGPVFSFGGVPYAAPPVGDLRFEAPEPVEAWTGVRDCTRPGPSAPQIRTTDEPVPGMTVASISEDCLTAEIWTPALDGSRPVLVWIPGGRFQIGGAGLATYDGSRLATEGDVVVVGLNYRLGAFGFLALEGTPTNVGLRDVLAALRWIRAEIGRFGGDPARVVVMGESIGAGTIAHLLAVPGTDALIAGAIVQSGAPGATLGLDTARQVSEALLVAAGVDSVAELPARCRDTARRAGRHRHRDAGHGRDDALPSGRRRRPPPGRPARIVPPPDAGRRAADHRYHQPRDGALPVVGAGASRIDRRALPRREAHRGPRRPARRRCRDPGSRRGGWRSRRSHRRHRSPRTGDAHRRRPRHPRPPRLEVPLRLAHPGIGAAHATDLPFTFGTLDVDRWRDYLGAGGASAAAADTLSERMRSAWTSFCHDLVPSSAPIGAWPRHDTTRRAVIRLGVDVDVVDGLDDHRHRAWTGTAPVDPDAAAGPVA